MKFNQALSMTNEATSLNLKDNLLETTSVVPTLKRSSRLSSGNLIDIKNKVSSKAPVAKKIVAKSLSTLLKGRAKLRGKILDKTKSLKSAISLSSTSSSSRESRLTKSLKMPNSEFKYFSKINSLRTFNLNKEQLKSEHKVFVFFLYFNNFHMQFFFKIRYIFSKSEDNDINEAVIKLRRSTRNSSPALTKYSNDLDANNVFLTNKNHSDILNSSNNILTKCFKTSSKNIKVVSPLPKSPKTSLIAVKKTEIDIEKTELKYSKASKQKLIDSLLDNKSSDTIVRRTRSALAKEEDFKTIEIKSNFNQDIDKSKLVCFCFLLF